MTRPYEHERFHLLTQHGKERVLAPLFVERLGAALERVQGFDTDTLGTFTRDVPRAGSQVEAARAKARVALERSGGTLGIGSEGAFVPGPLGLGSVNLEVVLLLDATRSIEVVGWARAPGLHVHGTARSLHELEDIARRAGFPEHGLVLRPDGPDGPCTHKGLRSWDELASGFHAVLRAAARGAVFVENDLRAHQHPSRMATVGLAGLDLVARLATLCPACSTPGFGRAGTRGTLPCACCGAPTPLPAADWYACVRCDFGEERAGAHGTTADPGSCEHCNP